MISKIYYGDVDIMEGVEYDLKVEDLVCFKYALIASVDIWRSFHTTKMYFQITDAATSFNK